MKILIFACLFAFVTFTQAQDNETEEGSAVGFPCYDGVGDNITSVFCGGTEPACQSKFEVQLQNGAPAFQPVVRLCTQLSACMNQAAGNFPKCFPGENAVRICFFCCTSSNCNNFDDLPEETTTVA